ncbi:MAG: Hpt domain-containing protein [Methanothrix sp.]
MERSDAKALQLAAHSLKSSSALIGAMHLSALAKELEMMGRSGILDRTKESAEKLRVEFHLAVKAGSRNSWLRLAARSPIKGKSYLLTILTVWPCMPISAFL